MTFNPLSGDIKTTLVDLADNPDIPLHGQLATVDGKGQPWVRTVHLRWVNDFQTVGIVTNTLSAKWQQLLINAACAVCIFSSIKRIQLRWQGTALLLDQDVASGSSLLAHWWQLNRMSVRSAYWQEYRQFVDERLDLETVDRSLPPPTYAAILFNLNRVEIMHYNETDYAKSVRELFVFQDNKWHRSKLSVISSKPLS